MTGNPVVPTYRGYVGEELVTGEGVALELPVASIGHRAASGLIDVVVGVVLLVGASWVTSGLIADQSFAVGRTGVLVTSVAVLVGLPTLVETLTRGRTLGKLALGLRVVREDGGPISFRHAFTRALIGWVEVYLTFTIVAAIAGLANARAKRLGDYAAGTYVISERSRLSLPPQPSMPPQLAAWAASADIASLDKGLAVAVRQFLPRAQTLLPGPREQLGRELLSRVLKRVSPMPPPGHHPETVLHAVAAERYRRDLERLNREQALRERVLPRGR